MNDLGKEITKNLLTVDAEIDFKIKSGIENNRKGFGTIKLFLPDGSPVQAAEIKLTQTTHEFRFGCNAFMIGQFPEREQNDQYEEKFREIFNLAVLPFYWNDLEPADGELRFDKNSAPVYRRPPPDLVLEFCEKHGITPKGHLLSWHTFLPEWLCKEKGKHAERLERRIREIAERYAGRIKIWDVANEALQWDTEYFEQMPERHVETAFKMAQKYFPEATELLYNDGPYVSWKNYHGDYTPLYMLAKSLLNEKLPLKGIGLQYHHIYNKIEEMADWAFHFSNQRFLYAVMDQYAKLGIPFNVSEITITSDNGLGNGNEFQELVAEKLYRLWFSHPASNGIIWWNLVDGTAYVPKEGGSGEDKYRGGLLNYDFSEKPAYSILRDLIKKEWNTRVNMTYVNGAENKFHGFYGDYEAVIKTNEGAFTQKFKLSMNSSNIINLERMESK